MIELFNEDCMDGMRRYPDNYFELAIVDPPYGIKRFDSKGDDKHNRFSLKKSGIWNKPPTQDYFDELFRVSKKQLIWGGNYFNLPLTGAWLYWSKDRQKDVSYADGELAWTNFLTTLKEIRIKYDGFLGADKDGRIHPTQKPVKLYEWLLKTYAKPGDKILDTHGGSMSSAIACHNMGHDLVLFELDKDYFEAGQARLIEHQKQQSLFDDNF